jgi:ornithine carbamoyltransferase
MIHGEVNVEEPSPPPRPGPALPALVSALGLLRRDERALLRGTQLGLVGHDGRAARTRMLVQAALDLGARVSLLEQDALAPSAEATEAARLLGRLYDGIDCDSTDAAMLAWLAEQSGLPVTALVTPGSATVQLLASLQAAPEATVFAASERPLRVLQAALVAAFGGRRG